MQIVRVKLLPEIVQLDYKINNFINFVTTLNAEIIKSTENFPINSRPEKEAMKSIKNASRIVLIKSCFIH